jgi:hypothetical protein
MYIQMENYKEKYLKYKKKYLNLKAQVGGFKYTAEIDLSKVLLRKSMVEYIKEKHPEINLDNYKLSKTSEVGLLTRMESQNSLSDEDFNKLLQKEPVEVTSISMEVKNPESEELEIVSFYEIDNGRHRVTSAIIRGLTKINARVTI